jgi:vacuolar protein sorting-associated protein IST1
MSQSKLKVHLKMAIQRLRMLQQKETAIAKQQRRHMAELLAVGKLESARIRVENIIRSDIATELHEILELYCELLLARIQLLDGYIPPSRLPDAEPAASVADDKDEDLLAGRTALDSGLDEAVRSIIYAAPRTDIKELTQARALLLDKMGKEYAASAAGGAGVPERIAKRLRVESPPAELVDAYLREIAKTYSVRFPGDPDPADVADDDDDDDGQPGDDSALAEHAELEPALQAEQSTAAGDGPPQVGSPGAALRIAPPSPTTENVAPKIKMPGIGPRKPTPSARAKEQSTSAPAPGSRIPDVDELERRFAALKKGS